MFSGIVEEKGIVQKIERKENLIVLSVKAKKVLKGIKIGDSISTDGVCLTVAKLKKDVFTFDIMKETMDKTTLKYLEVGSRVNLEGALRVNDRLGGHFVSGHIDGVGTIKKRISLPNYEEFQILIPKSLARYLAPKGSVCIDGISLTIGEVKGNMFFVYIIPHTLKVTTLGSKKDNDKVNIETDLLAKYILSAREQDLVIGK
ncbi:MAG: riboflavin synthase [Candidatus Omnitrophica bacterium]|nr:riboflavin synthase [Candidatus Omnitrophota bacterium]